MRHITVIALLTVLVSCASAPNLKYYTLDMRTSHEVGSDANLIVGRFTVAEKIDRHQIVIQQSPTKINYYAKDRWASNVGEMVEHKLAAEFGEVDPGEESLIVEGRIVAFEQVDTDSGPMARVGLEIAIRDGNAKRYETPLLEKNYEAEQPASDNTVDAVVQAMSRAVEEIAAEITTDAAEL